MEIIEKLRAEIYELLNSCECSDARIITKSEQLDKEINLFYCKNLIITD